MARFDQYEGLSQAEMDALIQQQFERTREVAKLLPGYVREDRDLPINIFSPFDGKTKFDALYESLTDDEKWELAILQAGIVGLWEDAGGVL